jgi:hypothetical protein
VTHLATSTTVRREFGGLPQECSHPSSINLENSASNAGGAKRMPKRLPQALLAPILKTENPA